MSGRRKNKCSSGEDIYKGNTMTEEDVKGIKIRDFDYPLPEERIAKFPLAKRDSSKLLIYNHGEISEKVFSELPGMLPSGALMIFNNTKVIQARLHFHKEDNAQNRGALIEIFLLEPASPSDYQQNFSATGGCSWYCLVGNLKRWKSGSLSRTVSVDGREIELTAERGEIHGTGYRIDFRWNDADVTFSELLEAVG